jgi:predicted metal-dependent HD superfamily phosphohydrolase
MSNPEVELRAAWHRSFGPTHPDLLDSLLARLREPHRRYHTAVHVVWVLRHLHHLVEAGARLADRGHVTEPVGVDLDAVHLAALYHDAVYDPLRADNEAISARLAVEAAEQMGWPPERCHVVHELVMATAGHVPADTAQALLVDADLAILGAEPAQYTAYVNGVRSEYAHIDAQSWRTGRAAVLQRFLDVPAVYSTDIMRHEREARARANMAAELAALTLPA